MHSELISNKSILITGGSHGFGAGLARRFVESGGIVTIADIDADRGSEFADEIGATFVLTDVTEYDANQRAVHVAESVGGGLDIVILNAGVTSGIGLGDDFDPVKYRRTMAINLDGVVYGVAASLPALKRRGGGDIIATASMAGIAPTPFDPIYATNKNAVVGLVRSFGLASVADNIKTNAICPAFADTRILAGMREGLVNAGVPLLSVDEVVDVYLEVLATGRSGECWFVQPGRPSEPFTFRRAPGPRKSDGSIAAAADPATQFAIERHVKGTD
ncbi:MAG: SDR family NAD(P)-dependent oxidoreductase [Candidatus Nanopelagicales bacterium]